MSKWSEQTNKQKSFKLYYVASAGAVFTLAIALAAIALASGFGGAIGWPMFFLFLFSGVATGLTAIYATYLDDKDMERNR